MYNMKCGERKLERQNFEQIYECFCFVLLNSRQQGLINYYDERRYDTLMLVTIRDDIWNVPNMQYITPNSKIWDYKDTPVGSTLKIKGPPTWLSVGR